MALSILDSLTDLAAILYSVYCIVYVEVRNKGEYVNYSAAYYLLTNNIMSGC